MLTVAAAFPTTVAPIIQAGAIPVFVDVRPDTANVDVAVLPDDWSTNGAPVAVPRLFDRYQASKAPRQVVRMTP